MQTAASVPRCGGRDLLPPADGSAARVEYFGNPQASAEKNSGRLNRSGDMGHMDEAGWLFFDYRAGGGIRHNGDFINPSYVEKALAEQDQIDDVFAYGVPAASGAPGEKDLVCAIVATDRASLIPLPYFAPVVTNSSRILCPATCNWWMKFRKPHPKSHWSVFCDSFTPDGGHIHRTGAGEPTRADLINLSPVPASGGVPGAFQADRKHRDAYLGEQETLGMLVAP